MTDKRGQAIERVSAERDAAIGRAEKAERDLARLTSLIQMCCDGSSEDDPAVLCARRVSELIAQRDEAELQLIDLAGSVWHVVAGDPRLVDYVKMIEERHQGVNVLNTLADLVKRREELKSK